MAILFQAKDMVYLSKDITNKIRDRQGEITEDEVTVCSVLGRAAARKLNITARFTIFIQ